MTDLCPNCESGSHARCCAWCGKHHTRRRLAFDHCSMKCEREQAKADKMSAAMEDGEVPRLNAFVRRGLDRMRSLASIEAANGIDLSRQEVEELEQAIAWLDDKMGLSPRPTLHRKGP